MVAYQIRNFIADQSVQLLTTTSLFCLTWVWPSCFSLWFIPGMEEHQHSLFLPFEYIRRSLKNLTFHLSQAPVSSLHSFYSLLINLSTHFYVSWINLLFSLFYPQLRYVSWQCSGSRCHRSSTRLWTKRWWEDKKIFVVLRSVLLRNSWYFTIFHLNIDHVFNHVMLQTQVIQQSVVGRMTAEEVDSESFETNAMEQFTITASFTSSFVWLPCTSWWRSPHGSGIFFIF